MKTILDINKKHEVASYPYGRLRTTAYFSIEFKKNKGFRSVFQTINPKTNQLNKPKYGTYNTFLCNTLDSENGHIETYGSNCNSFESINKLAEFIRINSDALNLTKEMIQEICAKAFTVARISARYMRKEINTEKLLQTIKPTVDSLIIGFKTGENVFLKIESIDTEKIKELEKEVELVGE